MLTSRTSREAGLVLDEEEPDPNGGAKDKEAVDWWIRRCQEWKEKYPVVLPKHYEAGDDEPANVYAAIKGRIQ